jgi:hypothetical protein
VKKKIQLGGCFVLDVWCIHEFERVLSYWRGLTNPDAPLMSLRERVGTLWAIYEELITGLGVEAGPGPDGFAALAAVPLFNPRSPALSGLAADMRQLCMHR